MRKKECPSCAMEIDDKSEICPICGYEFPKLNKFIAWAALFLAIIFLLMLLF